MTPARATSLLEIGPRRDPTCGGETSCSTAVDDWIVEDRTWLRWFGKTIPDWVGIRTRRFVYVEYQNRDRELYDLRVDPDETTNLAGTRPGLERTLHSKLEELRGCRAAECRALDRSRLP